MSFTAYLPRDRAFALARGEEVLEHAFGAALFADISGFTTLTDALARELGPHRGAEELTRHLNAVYDALIVCINQHDGNVISFSGDAVTCWFDTASFDSSVLSSEVQSQGIQDSALRAVACGLALQDAMRQVADIRTPGGQTITLALKVAVATGDVRRLLVGDPAIQQIDVLAGATMLRLAAVEHQAQADDVIVDQETAALLSAALHIGAWREDQQSGTRAALVTSLDGAETGSFGEAVLTSTPALSFEQARPLLLPAIAERLERGYGDAPTELRPVVALFLRFATLDYDNDPAAGVQLDAYIGWVQNVIARYGGTLLDVSIGDKGSYLFAAFGAPVAHENDPERALRAALDLQALPPKLAFAGALQIGIARGTMRTGAYGGSGRLTYGVLGDSVNVAARLMQAASAGQVLVQDAADIAGADLFAWEGLPPLRVKGKPRPVAVFRLLAAHEQPAQSFFDGALIGRESELERLVEAARPALEGAFVGVCVVNGEAGVGKSRLVFALRQRMEALSSMTWAYCPSDDILRGSLRPFTAWLRDYFTQSAQHSESENDARFTDVLDRLIETVSDERRKTKDEGRKTEIDQQSATDHQPAITDHRELAAELTRTRSFLGALLGLRSEGSLYEQLDPKLRFENTLLALTALIRAESLRQPLVLELEDAHWLDQDSQTLLTHLARTLSGYPVAIVCAARPDDQGRPFALTLAEHTPVCTIDLEALSFEGTRTLVTQVLHSAVDDELARFVYDRTGGNPFFTEQLLLDLRERRLIQNREPRTESQEPKTENDNTESYTQFSVLSSRFATDVPHTLNSLLVARLDRLDAPVREVVQTAAVLGREWALPVLAAMRSGDDALPPKVRAAEDGRIWSPLDERDYLFRHVLLRDAAYGMQLQAQRRELHRRALDAIEQEYAENLASQYATLAYHAREAEDRERERRYARLAGETAAARYANAEAISYLSRTLELTPEEDLEGRWEVLLAREGVYNLIAHRGAQQQDLASLTDLVKTSGDYVQRTEIARRRADYARRVGDYGEYIIATKELTTLVGSLDKTDTAVAAQLELGWMLAEHEQFDAAKAVFTTALDLSREIDIQRGMSFAFNGLGGIALSECEYLLAQTYYEQSLAIDQRIGNRRAEAIVWSNLAEVVWSRGDYVTARTFCEAGLELARASGDEYCVAWSLLGLAFIAYYLADFPTAKDICHKALVLSQAIGDRDREAHTLTLQAHLLFCGQQYTEARASYEQALAIRRDFYMLGKTYDILAGLARIEQAEDNNRNALVYVETMLHDLDRFGYISNADEPFHIELTCYQVLHAANDPRAHRVLEDAYQRLQAHAAKLPDEAARRMLLENVPHHRALVAAWQAAQGETS